MGERAAVSAALFQEGRSRMTAKQLPDDTYLDKIYTMLAQIEQEEGAAMDAAARAAYASIDGGGLLHVFSTGHSHMIVEEMFYRSGGLVPVNPILSDELMLHTGAITSTHMERMPGKAAEVLGKAGLRAGDTILISSNTGRLHCYRTQSVSYRFLQKDKLPRLFFAIGAANFTATRNNSAVPAVQ